MPTVDDILGPAPKPTVDAILGAPPPGAFDWGHDAPPEVPATGATPGAKPPANTPQEHFLATTRQGRVLDAVGQGIKTGWGTEPIGLSPETERFLSGVGILPQAQNGILGPLRAFNEALIRPAAAAWDVGTRALNSATYGFSALVGANVGEAEGKKGMDWDAARDTLALAQTLGIVSGEGRVEVPTARDTLSVPAEPPMYRASPGKIAGEHADDMMALETQAMQSAAAVHTPAVMSSEPRPSVMAADRTDTPQQPHTLYGPAESTVTDKAGNIRLDLLTDDESVKDVIRQVANENDDFKDVRRSVPTGLEPVERERIAEALGMSSEALNERAIGEAFTKGQIESARKMLVESANNVQSLARAASADGATEADILAYAKAEQQHLMIQGGVARITHVWGEAGNAFKSLQAEVGEAQSVGDVIKNATGHSLDEVKARAASVRDMNDPNGVSRSIFDLAKPTWKDKFLEYWINGLLSGPATHSTYMISNGIFALWKAGLETPAAALVGRVRQLFGNKGERVYYGETWAALHGIYQGAADGIVPAWQSMKTGQTASLPGENAIKANPFYGAKRPAIGGVAGKLIRIPSNVIAGMHTLTRAAGYRQELNRLAYRQAAKEGLDGQDFATRVSQLTNNPTEEMMTDATTGATEQAFMGRLHSKFGAALETLANSNLAAKMVMPFVRVGSNIVNQALLERTPLGLLSSDIRANLAGANGKIAQDAQIAKMGVSAVAATAIAGLAVKGHLTGAGPNEPTKAAIWRLAGNQPYSIRIGDNWYSYHRFGVLGLQMGAIASAYEVMHEATNDETANIGTLAMSSISKNILDESWFRGLSDVVQANADPGRYGERYIANLVASVAVPFSVGSGQVARMMDPDVRQIHGIVDTIKARIPVLSQTLAPKLDIWGQPIPNEGALGVATAIYQSRVNHDPVTQELLALGMHPAPPEQTIKGAKLTPEQYDEYQQKAGVLAHTTLSGLVTMDGWHDVPPFAREEVIRRTIERSRKAAATYIQLAHPDVIQTGVDNKLKQINGVEK